VRNAAALTVALVGALFALAHGFRAYAGANQAGDNRTADGAGSEIAGDLADRTLMPAAGLPVAAPLVRVTSSFEVGHASAVLKQVAKLFSAGFVRKDAEQLAKLIDALSAEQSRSWEFNGLRKGVSYPLRVRARIDEFGQLDLDFFTAPALAVSVRGAVDGYLNARGL
jgi:hypothetical protein